MRQTALALLSGTAVAVSGGCTSDTPSTVQEICRELRSLAEPYAVKAATPPFDLLRPTGTPAQWREDGEAIVEAAEPLAGLGGTRLRDLAGRWVALGQYLVRASSDPGEYDVDAVAERLYPADGGCSTAVERAV